ncbi:MAG: lipase maturation factor family protein [Herpetosiphonaceae bacterium]|nr:lipase maturation factor family protein [Herpetosiphonaceae bacterium]
MFPTIEHVQNVWQRMRGRREQASYRLTLWIFLRLLGGIYLANFASLSTQVMGLLGQKGILPAADYLENIPESLGAQRYWLVPTLTWFNRSDSFLRLLCGGGMVLAVLLILDILPIPVLIALWMIELSIISVGQDFLSFQWDILLLETGFLAIFAAPGHLLPHRGGDAAPSRIVMLLLWWLVFRLMFLSGVVKLASGDPNYWNLTALTYHYETQPLPTPLAWYVEQLPRDFHKLSVALMFVIELGLPWLIWLPRPLRVFAALGLIGLQVLILLTGNYAFFNLLAIVLCLTLLDDAMLCRVLPRELVRFIAEDNVAAAPTWRGAIHLPLAALLLLISGIQISARFRPASSIPRPLLSFAGQFDSFRLANTYGLFAVMTTMRQEIIVEGSDDGQTWHEYEFRWKPDDVHRAPPVVAPHQPRLDWQMWFAALGSAQNNPWFTRFLIRLLEGSPEVTGLLQTNPFPHQPPRYVRAQLYTYHFTHVGDSATAGAWWRREYQGLYFPSVSLRGQ